MGAVLAVEKNYAAVICSKSTMQIPDQYEMYLKLTTKTPEQGQWRRFSVFIVYFEEISHIVLVLPLLNLIK